MTALPLVITNAGWTRFTGAQLDDDIDLEISSVGLTATPFVMSPTLTALPGKFRDVETISGQAVDATTVHLTIRDDAAIGYTVRGFGLFLSDGTLFAVYGQADPIFEKSPLSTMLIALDVAFASAVVDELVFGDTNFLYPPATTETRGVVELATEAEGHAGEDPERVITPAVLNAVVEAMLQAERNRHDPIGTVKMWWGDAGAAPLGWAICAGQTVARSDGAGNITLPDMRDRVPIGASTTNELGELLGAFSKTVTSAEAGAHAHAVGDLAVTVEESTAGGLTLSYTIKNDTASGGTGRTLSVPPDPSASAPQIIDPGHDHDAELSGQTAGASDHSHGVTIDVTQPSLALHFIMRI